MHDKKDFPVGKVAFFIVIWPPPRAANALTLGNVKEVLLSNMGTPVVFSIDVILFGVRFGWSAIKNPAMAAT